MALTPILDGCYVADLSHWNPETKANFVEARQNGLVGVIVKYSQGQASADPAAVQLIWDAYDAGVDLLGGYHFGDASDPLKQAHFFLRQMMDDFVSNLDGRLVMLDLEANRGSPMSVENAETFVSAIRAALGRWPVLYMGRNGPDGRGTGLPSKVLSNCDLMLPAYGKHPDLAPSLPPGFRVPANDSDRGGCVRLHQFTDGSINGGPVAGLGKVDQSHVVGFSSVDALAAWWGR